MFELRSRSQSSRYQPVGMCLLALLLTPTISGAAGFASPAGIASPVVAIQEATDQAAATAETTEAQTPQLKFSFYQQPWQDVLNWMAQQADLSLVINQVPPGDFTYSDTRSYSPTESIDLLNSVLMTKQFTLVRKDKMLIVLSTKEGIPYDLIPQVSTDQLKDRGRFELVSVTFPLEGRPLDTVQNEIKPLVGELGRVFPMPATGKIQVTETGGKLAAIAALIQSIPTPKPPKKPDPKPKPPTPVLKPYAVTDLDLEPTSKLLSKAVGGIQATADETSNQIFIYATEPQHEAVAKVLETLRADPHPDAVVAQSYRYTTAAPATLVQQLIAVAPTANIQIDAATRRLIVVANKTSQDSIKMAIEEIQGPEQTSLQLRAYEVAIESQPQVTKAITDIIPTVSVTPQQQPEKLLVIATESQQMQVQQLIQQFRDEGLMDASTDKKLEVFRVENLALPTAVALLQPLHPTVKFTQDAETLRLLALVDKETAEQIRDQLDELDQAPDQSLKPSLKAYPITQQKYQKLSTFLAQLAPKAQVTWDAQQKQMMVVANDKGHAELTALLDSLPEMEAAEDAILKVFPVSPEQKTRFTAILPTLTERFPSLKLVPEGDVRRLTVWAPPEEMEELQQVLDSLQVDEAQHVKRVLKVYPLTRSNPVVVHSTLVKLFPTVDIVLEADSERLVVWATAEEQDEIGAAVQQLDVGSEGGAHQATLQTYPLKKTDPAIARQAVVALIPGLTLTIDSANRSLVAWGKDRDHKKLTLMLQQMEATAAGDQRVMQVYDATDQNPIELSRIIQQMAPTAIISADRRSKGVAVWATGEEHQAIDVAVKQLAELENNDQRQLVTLETVHTGGVTASQLLRGVAPDAFFFPSKDDRSVFSYAEEKDQARIKSVMEQLEAQNAASVDADLRTYTSRKSILTTARPLLTARLPKVQWIETGVSDRWLVSGSPEDHEVIEEVLGQLKDTLPDSMEQSLAVYTLENVSVPDAQQTISSLVGTVTYLASSQPQQLRIWATPSEHQQIDDLLKQLESQLNETDQTRPLKVYSIDPSTEVATVFQALDPATLREMTVIQNVPRNALIVRGSAEKHKQLSEEIDTFIAALPDKIQRRPVVYPLEHVAPEAARQLLVTLVPTATYAVDATNGNLAATALPEEHLQIAEAVKQIDVATETPLETKAYRVPTGYASAIRSSLLPMYPQAMISTDFTASTLIVAATEKQHSEIKQIVEDVLLGSAQDRSSVVYSLRIANPQSVLGVLKQVFPQSQATADGASGSVVVTASETEHQQIAKLLEDLDTAGKDRFAEVYRVRNANPLSAQQALAAALPRASITVDRTGGLLIATASAEDHKQIKQTIDQMENSENEDLQTKAYTLTGADPRSAQVALESLLPSAQFSADRQSGLLIATASTSQHQRIQSVVDQMENSDTDKPHARAIEIDGGNSERLYAMLNRMYRWDDKVRFTYESTSGTIMFVGPKRQEEAVMELVDQWNAVVKKEQPRTVKVYELMEVDGDGIVDSLDELFEEQAPKPDLQIQWYTNKLIAVATPEQHVMIENTIQQIRGKERVLEVFSLVVNSPETVEDAIDQMFIDLPSGGSPSITSSVDTQQIFVRATPSQLEEVRSLLIKLGEPAEAVSGDGNEAAIGTSRSAGGTGNVRVLSSANADQMLERLKQVWPQISRTPLQIVPAAGATKESTSPENSHQESEDSKQDLPPIRTSIDAVSQEDAASQEQDEQQPIGAPLIIIPGPQQITVASEDLQALQVFQELFEVMQQQEAEAGKTEITGNFTIFQLQNAGAKEIAQSVQQLYQQISGAQNRGRGRGGNRSRVSIVADERLNALIVYGPPNDRRTIDQLIKVLDTNDISYANSRLNQPRIVSVKNVEADRIMDVLQSVYRTQLRPDQPPRIQIPAGVSVEVAVALREANAVAAAPLLTLEVDEATNSIIVLASERLGTEVESLIERLDQQNKDSNARSIRVIPLEDANTERIEDALQRLMRRSRSRR